MGLCASAPPTGVEADPSTERTHSGTTRGSQPAGLGSAVEPEVLVASKVATACLVSFRKALSSGAGATGSVLEGGGEALVPSPASQQACEALFEELRVPEPVNEGEHLLCLDFSKAGLDRCCFGAVTELVVADSPISSLGLGGVEVGPDLWGDLCKAIRFNSQLRELDLSDTNLGAAGVQELCKCIKNQQGLQSLRLDGIGADDAVALALSHIMLADTKLAHLSLARNRFTATALACFTVALRCNGRIQTLGFGGNLLGPLDAGDSVTALLDRNQVVAHVIDHIVDAATSWEQVREFRLGSLMSYEKQAPPALDGVDTAAYNPDCVPLGGTCAGRKFVYGQAETVGRRDEMQDVVLMKSCFRGRKDEHLFGVFDGGWVVRRGWCGMEGIEHSRTEQADVGQEDLLLCFLFILLPVTRLIFFPVPRPIVHLLVFCLRTIMPGPSPPLPPPPPHHRHHRRHHISGHGGVECSRFVGANFPHVFENFLRRDAEGGRTQESVRQAFMDTFAALNEMCKKFRIPHGSCAVVCFIQNDMVHTASVGDSLAVLARTDDGGAVKGQPVNQVWKPTLDKERERIEQAGGFITDGRVGGILAVSRAVGDIALQPFVSPVPSVDCVQLGDKDCSLVMACDGVWDVHDAQTSVELIHGEKDPHTAGASSARV